MKSFCVRYTYTPVTNTLFHLRSVIDHRKSTISKGPINTLSQIVIIMFVLFFKYHQKVYHMRLSQLSTNKDGVNFQCRGVLLIQI